MVNKPRPPLKQRAKETAAVLLERAGSRPRVAMLLGAGHASVAGQVKDKHIVADEDLTGLHLGRGGSMVFGDLEGVPVVISDAPLASYEGASVEDSTFPIRVFRELGCDTLVLTAGAASLTAQLEPGSLAVVEDHINLSGVHPLQGPNDDNIGPRFPDMSRPYSETWLGVARSVAMRANITCLPGVFAAVPGPSLPTRAEYRFLRRAGADLVGMSLVPEVVAAVHSGFDILALVGITQQVLPDDRTPVSIESMLDAAEVVGPRMASVLVGCIASLSP